MQGVPHAACRMPHAAYRGAIWVGCPRGAEAPCPSGRSIDAIREIGTARERFGMLEVAVSRNIRIQADSGVASPELTVRTNVSARHSRRSESERSDHRSVSRAGLRPIRSAAYSEGSITPPTIRLSSQPGCGGAPSLAAEVTLSCVYFSPSHHCSMPGRFGDRYQPGGGASVRRLGRALPLQMRSPIASAPRTIAAMAA